MRTKPCVGENEVCSVSQLEATIHGATHFSNSSLRRKTTRNRKLLGELHSDSGAYVIISRCNFLTKPLQRFVEICLVFLLVLPAQAEIRVGLAVADITPPIGGLTTGYSSAKPTDGVHDPVSARVVLLSSPAAQVALVSCDLCIFNSEWLHEQMPALGIDRLLLMNTHTHAGPKMSQDDFPSPESPWRKTAEERILAAIKQAQSSQFVGYFAASESAIQLGYNRLVHRGEFSETHFENPERIPYGHVAPEVGVIRVTDAENRVRAILFHYACHPVVLGPRNLKISADYPGVVRRILEEKYGADCTAVFIQGGAGDINPLFLARGDSRENDFEVVERMGELLATEVQRALAFIDETPGKSNQFLAQSSEASFRHRFEPDQSLTLGVTSLLINDDIGIVTMPGEPFHKFQLDVRRQAGLEHAFLFGYCCNGAYSWPSYIPDLVSAGRGGYGASDTTKAEVGSGERLVNDGLVQLLKLRGRLKPQPQRHTFKPASE
ncbi:MAG: neutral/alkaline non-lysosomal ceramidase N-terminal domain-containing protein [Planctomycetales bacterium]|nr:neutral/alkaline non-lysosomal ceramidase N-terminal domain-containing protein [Planctomycetales bacterium]